MITAVGNHLRKERGRKREREEVREGKGERDWEGENGKLEKPTRRNFMFSVLS